MTIYEVLNNTVDTDAPFSTPDDIRPEVELALGDQFGKGASQWDDVKAKFKSWKKFVDEVIKVLVTLDCDDSWLDDEVYLQIENIGQDLLDGNEIGASRNLLEDIMGVNEDGTLNRTSSFDIF